jgi:hypothetical protein
MPPGVLADISKALKAFVVLVGPLGYGEGGAEEPAEANGEKGDNENPKPVYHGVPP